MKVSFDSVFQINPDGSITLKVPVFINGETMGSGVSFTTGVSFGGVDLASLHGKDLDVKKENDIVVIQGYFNC
jgi:hypothetical protein